jgi:hypothetical protein
MTVKIVKVAIMVYNLEYNIKEIVYVNKIFINKKKNNNLIIFNFFFYFFLNF